MHPPDRILQQLLDQSVAGCAAYFATQPQSRPLTSPELRVAAKQVGSASQYVAGWETGGSDSDPSVVLWVLLDERTPFSTPQYLLRGDSRFGIWPHVERTNRLCVIPHPDTHAYSDCMGLAVHLLGRAKELIHSGQAGTNQADFLSELESYWATHDHTLAVTLSDPERADALDIRLHNGHAYACTHENADSWFHRLGIPEQALMGAYIPLDTAILPKDFPGTVDGFRSLLAARGITDPLQALRHDQVTAFYYVLGVPRGGGAVPSHVYLGIRLDAPAVQAKTTTWYNQRQDSPREEQRNRGFRHGKLAPPYDLRRSFPGSQVLQRICIQRCDATWIHSRGGIGGQSQLSEKKVIVIGCGSLGSSVAALLAKAGVGTTALFDPETLTWDNVARHEHGGIAELGFRKNSTVAASLSRRFPHLTIDGSSKETWQNDYHAHPKRWSSADLIVTTTGNWASDAQLNIVHRHGGLIACPVLYGFLEAHAAAGQAITIETTGACYQCGVNLLGFIQRAVFQWGTSQLKQEPACGAFYQPYGAADMAPVARMIANAAVARLLEGPSPCQRQTWIGDATNAAKLGGMLNPDAGIPASEVLAGNRQVGCDWPSTISCPACGSQAHLN